MNDIAHAKCHSDVIKEKILAYHKIQKSLSLIFLGEITNLISII